MNRFRRTAAMIVLASCSATFNAAHSHAATFQVASPGQPGSDVACAPCSSIHGALVKAQSSAGTDTIHLGVGIYAESVEIPLGNPVSLVGSGASGLSATTLTSPGGAPVISIAAGAVRDLRVTGANRLHLVEMSGGTLERVVVQEYSSNISTTGVVIHDGGLGTPSIVDSSILLPPVAGSESSWGVTLFDYNTSVNITHTTIVADRVFGQAQGGVINARRMKATGRDQVLNDGVGGRTEIRNSFMRQLSALPAFTLFPHDAPNRVTRLKMYNSTLVGGAQPGSHAFQMFATNDDNSVQLVLRDSVIHRFATNLSVVESGLGSATADIRYSFFNERAMNIAAGVTTPPVFYGNIFTKTPGFINEAAYDYRLAPGSQLIDAGNPAGLAKTDSTVDLRGLPRMRDGNHDGTVRRDIGAYEYQPAVY